jgi:uncharacterized protein YfkK (UPF0435 family)
MDEIKPIIEKLNQVNIAALKREGRDFDFTDIHSLIMKTIKIVDQFKEK